MGVGRILIVEDDQDICRLVVRVLAGAGFAVSTADSGAAALQSIRTTPHDLAVIDLGLPDMDGLSLVRDIRQAARCGIIILSGRSEPLERIIGLEVGADDYVPKPFEPRELLARVKSVLRRIDPAAQMRLPVEVAAPNDMSVAAPVVHAPEPPTDHLIYAFEGWRFDASARCLLRPDGNVEDLTTGEFNLLLALIERAGRVLSRDQLLDATHGQNTPAYDRSVDVQVARLRRKLQDDADTAPMIKTVRNGGYMFAARVYRT